MANDLNRCEFIGRLGADPEQRYLPSGDPVTTFRIAVGWKTKEKEGTEWVPIATFGKLAEICSEYLRKGSQVFVAGRWKTDEYEKNGEKRYSTKIVADSMQMLGKREGGEGPRESAPPRSGTEGASRKTAEQPAGGNFNDFDDDIPF